MYKHWDNQKKNLVDLILAGKSASCQVCIGTNYSIFFRNLHSDLLLKKSIIPVYIDVSSLNEKTPYNIFKSTLFAIKRTLLEKKLSSKLELVGGTIEEIFNEIEENVKDLTAKGYTFTLFVEDFELIGDNTQEVLFKFESIKANYEKASFIYLTKLNVFHPKNLAKFSKAPHLYENVLYFPVKDESYLRSLEKGVSAKIFKEMYELTGGVDSFFSISMDLKNNLSPRERRHITRYIHDNLHLKKEVSKMWDSFSEEEIKVLSQIVWGSREVEDSLVSDLTHLINLGLVQRLKKGYKISVGLLRSVGVEKASKRSIEVEYERDKVVINGHEVSVKLSEVEKRVLRQLLQNKNKIVGSSAIAKSVWNNSDPSKQKLNELDNVVTELKTKLATYWVSPDKFLTVEGKGFLYRE